MLPPLALLTTRRRRSGRNLDFEAIPLGGVLDAGRMLETISIDIFMCGWKVSELFYFSDYGRLLHGMVVGEFDICVRGLANEMQCLDSHDLDAGNPHQLANYRNRKQARNKWSGVPARMKRRIPAPEQPDKAGTQLGLRHHACTCFPRRQRLHHQSGTSVGVELPCDLPFPQASIPPGSHDIPRAGKEHPSSSAMDHKPSNTIPRAGEERSRQQQRHESPIV